MVNVKTDSLIELVSNSLVDVETNSVVSISLYKGDDKGLLAHLEESRQYREIIKEAAEKAFVDESVIWGIGSRESGWGLLLKPKGPGGTGDWSKRPKKTEWREGPMPPDGLGFGRGLMQIDYDAHHEFSHGEEWKDARENILYGASVILSNKKYIRKRKELDIDNLIIAAVAAYNCGCHWVLKTFEKSKDVDFYTKRSNYSKDVTDRAKWFQTKGWK